MRPEVEPVSRRPTPRPMLGVIVSAVIPCLDEEDAIGAVVSDVLAQGIDEVVVREELPRF